MRRPQQSLLPRPRRVGRSKQKADRVRDGTVNRCYDEHKTNVRIGSQPGDGWEPYLAPKINSVPKKSIGLVRFKVSDAWFRPARPKKAYRNIPYIDSEGFIHAQAIYVWRCSAPQLLATIMSTVHKRLMGITRNQDRKKRCNMDLLFKISAYYTITNNDSFLRRCLIMMYKTINIKDIRRFVYQKINNMDANRRFLYDQVGYPTLWFQSRIRHSPIREKSRHDVKSVLINSSPAAQSRTWGPEDIGRFVDEVTAWSSVY